uniref:Coiled-coil domain-containing protein n=1 Tax=Panagrolaimus sp. ES5 TaxID=591445 RepID=A0AC34FX28_9BILA
MDVIDKAVLRDFADRDVTVPNFGNVSVISGFARSTPKRERNDFQSVDISEQIKHISLLLSSGSKELNTQQTTKMSRILESCIDSCYSNEETLSENQVLLEAVNTVSELENSVLMLKKLRLVNRGKALFSPSQQEKSGANKSEKSVALPHLNANSSADKKLEYESNLAYITSFLSSDSTMLDFEQKKEYRTLLSSCIDSCFIDKEPLTSTIRENEVLLEAISKVGEMDNSILMLKKLRLVKRGKLIFSSLQQLTGCQQLEVNDKSEQDQIRLPEFPDVPTHDITAATPSYDPNSTAAGMAIQLSRIREGANNKLRQKRQEDPKSVEEY